MIDYQPLITRRMLALRQFPALASIELHEVALLAENVDDISYNAGDVVAAAGRASSIDFIVDGAIRCDGRDHGPRDTLGLLRVLARHELDAPAVAMQPTRTLRLLASDLPDVFEEAFGVLRGILRELAIGVAGRIVPQPSVAIPESSSLGLIDRLVVLRQLVPFAAARPDALAEIARASEEAVFAPGMQLAIAGTRADAMHVILDGAVRPSVGTAPAMLGRGAALGSIEVLGELVHRRTYEAVTPVRTLTCSATAIFDVLEDHLELGLSVLERLAAAML